ncbi:MAG: hypothetical protein WBN27_04530 [Eudoraea sp.]|uniref:hypothetical protein n=1 Tax=Eudoraea sp. TaxID=1979955 RepID=UPI003C771237
MKTISTYFVVVIMCFIANTLVAQDNYKEKINDLKEQKEKITLEEKEALKVEVESINKRLEKSEITTDEANKLKDEAARKRALNIENRLTIIDNKIVLLERNKGEVLDIEEDDNSWDDNEGVTIRIDGDEWEITDNKYGWSKYGRRTYSDFIVAFGLNNAIIEGQSLNDTPYKVGGSRFFEMGWAWRTRVFNKSNAVRFHYGFSFQFNGLKSKDNLYYVVNDQGETVQEEFPFNLSKSKLKLENLVFPIHFEFGPSRTRISGNDVRYSLRHQFRIGLGGYGGFNMGTRQKLKYNESGSNQKLKIKGGLNSNPFIYGLSAYMGVDCFLLYVKYDLNPIFKSPSVEQRNISMGLRFDI